MPPAQTSRTSLPEFPCRLHLVDDEGKGDVDSISPPTSTCATSTASMSSRSQWTAIAPLSARSDLAASVARQLRSFEMWIWDFKGALRHLMLVIDLGNDQTRFWRPKHCWRQDRVLEAEVLRALGRLEDVSRRLPNCRGGSLCQLATTRQAFWLQLMNQATGIWREAFNAKFTTDLAKFSSTESFSALESFISDSLAIQAPNPFQRGECSDALANSSSSRRSISKESNSSSSRRSISKEVIVGCVVTDFAAHIGVSSAPAELHRLRMLELTRLHETLARDAVGWVEEELLEAEALADAVAHTEARMPTMQA